MDNRVCILIPYFGKFPNYFNLWLSSAKQCSKIDFYIITDTVIFEDKYNNIHFVKDSLEEIKNRASNILGFDCILDTPYKLCDYKPFYNLLFPNISKKYEYWGYGDIDLIYGNLNHLFELGLFDKYLVVFKLGHLSFIKNDPRCNIFDLVDNPILKKVYSSNNPFYFDERDYSRYNLLSKKYPDLIYDNYLDIADISPVYSFLWPPEEQYKTLTPIKHIFKKEKDGRLTGYYLENNTIYQKEFLYIHLIKRKMRNKLKNVPNEYYIVPCRFVTYKGIINKVSFRRLSRCDIISLFRRLKKRVNNKINRILKHE